jgi:hypothetical protein
MISESVPATLPPRACITYGEGGGGGDGSERKKKENERYPRSPAGKATSRFDTPSFLLLGISRFRKK